MSSRWFDTRVPTQRIELKEFERLATCRIELLKNCYVYDESVLSRLYDSYAETLNFSISHHIVRLLVSSDTSIYDWFIRTETNLLRFQLLHFANSDELEELMPNGFIKEDSSYRVPFSTVPELVATRSVEISQGFAKLSLSQVPVAISQRYKAFLRQELEGLNRASKYHPVDERIEPLGQYLFRFLHNPVYRCREGMISIEQVDEAAEKYFPLCMKTLHERLRRDHHLKYDGRNQYRMFLKGLGWTVQESLEFWTRAFEPSVSVLEFEKRYAYHIRHSYGLEGSRINYDAFSCTQILNLHKPSTGQCHGCPFATLDREKLTVELNRSGVYETHSILQWVDQKQYTKACAAHFNQLHTDSIQQVEHPNEWFDRSKTSTDVLLASS